MRLVAAEAGFFPPGPFTLVADMVISEHRRVTNLATKVQNVHETRSEVDNNKEPVASSALNVKEEDEKLVKTEITTKTRCENKNNRTRSQTSSEPRSISHKAGLDYRRTCTCTWSKFRARFREALEGSGTASSLSPPLLLQDVVTW